MHEINNHLIRFRETLIEPFQSVNRAAFEIARSQNTTSPRELPAINNQFTSSPPPPVPWAHNFKNVHDHRELLNDSLNSDFEYLVKVETPKGLKKGQKITLKTNTGNVDYMVYRKIATAGLVSYALKPLTEGHLPLIVFRCTEPDPSKEHSFHSMQNDTDEKIGERGWLAARNTFIALMKDRGFRAKGQKIIVGGYSLGGAHAQYFVSEHHSRISRAIFYCDPSIDPQVADDFVKKVHQPIVLQIFRTWGDPAPHFGGKHLGCGVNHPNVKIQLLEVSIPYQDRFDTELHSRRIFQTEDYNYTVEEFVDPEILAKKLDNSQRDCITARVEKLRKTHGKFFSKLLGAASSIKSSLIRFIEDEAQLNKKSSRNVNLSYRSDTKGSK